MFVPIQIENPTSHDTTPWATRGLIAVNIAVFVLALMVGLLPVINVLGYFPGQFTAALAHGHITGVITAIINLITHQFIHSGFLHLFFNMAFLFTFGQALERRLGSKVFAGTYLALGLIAAMAQSFAPVDLAIVAQLGHVPPMVGASGAILGVMGAYVGFWPKAKLIVSPLPPYPIPAWAFAAGFFLLQAATAMGGVSGVGYAAHAIGFAAGYLAAWYMRRQESGKTDNQN